MKTILNIYNHLLAYSDSVGNTDNPQQRNFDWSRKMSSVLAKKTASDIVQLQPGESKTIMDETVSTGISAGDTLSIASLGSSTYKLSIDSGSGEFNTGRAVTGLAGTDVTVAINNNSLAKFTFDGAVDISTVQVGDIMRVAGVSTFGTAPYAFADINSGIWKVLAVGPDNVQVVRTDCFAGANEVATSVAATDVIFYAQDGVAEGHSLLIDGTFSSASQSSYTVVDATSDCVFFTSTSPIPEESAVSYVAGSISIYKKARFLVYLETDQKTILRINGDTGDSLKVSPITVGKDNLVGIFEYTGLCYQLEIVNNSINSSSVMYFTAE